VRYSLDNSLISGSTVTEEELAVGKQMSINNNRFVLTPKTRRSIKYEKIGYEAFGKHVYSSSEYTFRLLL
jgi:hypothetical protein